MENNFFLNEAPIPPPSSSSPSSSIPTWNSLSSSPMDLQPSSFFNPTWQNPTLHHQQFHSASPNHNLPIRELIGKLGNINNETNHNNHSTNPPLMPPLNSTSVAEFSADPGFAERAAKFSCFGSRSFNGRTTTTTATTHTQIQDHRSDAPPLMMTKMMMQNGGGRLHRVSSTPSLKPLQSQSSNTNSPLNSQEEDESTISHQNPNGEISGIMMKPSPPDVNSRKRKPSSSSSSKASKPKDSSTSSLIPPPKGGEANEDSNAKRRKGDEGEGNEEGKQNKSSSNESKPAEPPKDYIHVRARRGQATDSHSLAERVRREKISERMKLLQDLVPGCNKVTGKALMLDEIINYVQSLQRQVEFLSMKLASVNTRLDLSIDNLITKDIFESNNNNNSIGQPGTAIFPSDSSAQPFCGQNPAIHTNANLTHCSVESLDNALFGLQLPPLNAFNELGSQYPMSFCEDDLHTIVQMGFGQTENRKTPTQSPVFNGSNQLSHMKVEL